MALSSSSIKSRHVAVIGDGSAGLVAARELQREGHSVVVFERQKQVGGTWIYTDHVESDPLSVDPTRIVVHSSVYGSLRTNLPRECMGFRDFTFVIRSGESRDPRRYPSHPEVLAYLQDFAKEFGIEELIRFETTVVRVSPAAESDGEEGIGKRKGKGRKLIIAMRFTMLLLFVMDITLNLVSLKFLVIFNILIQIHGS